MLREGLGEEKEEEDGCFMLLNVFEGCNTRPSEFGSPEQADPAPIFSALVKKLISHTKDVIMQIPMVRIWIIVLGTSEKIVRRSNG